VKSKLFWFCWFFSLVCHFWDAGWAWVNSRWRSMWVNSRRCM